MKLQLLSDIHLEQWPGRETVQIRKFEVKADTLALAGDICYLKELHLCKEVFEEFCSRWKTVIYTPGNHEFYTSNPKTCWNNLLITKMGLSNLHVLDVGKVEVIDGRRWIGGTLWFPHQPDNPCYYSLMNDFFTIDDFTPWVYKQCDETAHNLKINMEPGDIVMTHHLPSPVSIHPKYKMSSLNRFFMCDLSELILEREPSIWFHGHTHEGLNYVLGKTKIISNPKGYLREKRDSIPFNPGLVIDI